MAKKIVQKKLASPLPVYGVGGVWLLCGLLFPLYRLVFLLVTALLSVGVYLLLSRICPAKIIQVEVDEPTRLTGDALADQVIQNGAVYGEQFQSLNLAIGDPQISDKIDHLADICQAIFAEITKNPDKAPQIRKFMNYFLPTTLKLLETYQNLDVSGASGENIQQTKENIRLSLEQVAGAFAKQLDNLFSGEALDISAETAVLQAVLAGEGLLSPQQNVNSAPKDDGEIKLQL
ncbi:MAG: 5-bromo-4-chloroindolyl phosphate hydrolysis family protein [Clostridiales bacterium]